MKNKKVKWAVIIAAILIVVFLGVKAVSNKNLINVEGTNLEKEIEYTVAKDNIAISVTGSGSVKPVDRRIIRSEINGIVDGIFVFDGEVVEKDQMLISLQSKATNSSQTEINNINFNIAKAQKELNDLYERQKHLNIYATISGVVSNLNLKAGEQINSNYNVAKIKDTGNSYIEVYFKKDSFDKISVGDKASLLMTDYFLTESGTVIEKDSTPVQMGAGSFGHLVTLKMVNPGGYSVGDLAQVTVNNFQGSYQGMDKGKIVETKEEQVIAKISGKIKSVNTENGKYINKDDIIAIIEGDDLSFSIAEKQNTINNYRAQLENLIEGDTVYSPIKGTVLKVNVSEEEVVDRTTMLMTVADLENMEVVIAVDELDINKINIGQEAKIASEVYPTEKFTGKVSKISLEGTSQSGVTTYEVTLKLDDRKTLMSGMNVDVEILAESRENVLVIPIDAVHKLQGEYMVTVKDSAGNKSDINVKLGLVTKNKVEITSGLKEGDVIVYKTAQPPNFNGANPRMDVMMPGMGGANHPPTGGNR